MYTDQTGHTIHLPASPKRIVSLVPSQTELLYDLGLDDVVTGITKFCIHPQQWFQTKTRIGGTKSVDLHLIKSLQPDLIIANKEENVKEQVEALRELFPVWTSDVVTLNDALAMITAVGQITDTAPRAGEIIADIIFNFDRLIPRKTPTNAAYLIWKDPYMTVGGDTFISHIMERAGMLNIYAQQQRYPVITIDELRTRNCELLLLSSEPYPFKNEHIALFSEMLPNVKIVLADGEMFSWYGSRLIQTPDYLMSLIRKI